MVQKVRRVLGETLDSSLIWKPTVCPVTSPLSWETRSAMATAAMRLGSVHTIRTGLPVW